MRQNGPVEFIGKAEQPICELGLDFKHPRLGLSTPLAGFTNQSQIVSSGVWLPDFPNSGKSIPEGLQASLFEPSFKHVRGVGAD